MSSQENAQDNESHQMNTLLSKHIGTLFGNNMLTASIKYFMETGTINGEFRSRLIAFALEYAAQQSQLAWEEGCMELLENMASGFIRNEHKVSEEPALVAAFKAMANNIKSFPIPPYPGQDKIKDRERETAIAFIDWIMENDCSCRLNPEGGYFWYQFDNPDAVFTHEQLYNLFLQSNTTQP